MAERLESALKEMQGKVEEVLAPYASLLAPGQVFVATVSVEQERFVRVVPDDSTHKLQRNDWEQIFGKKWRPTYLEVLRALWKARGGAVQLRKLGSEFGGGDRWRLNAKLKKAGLPYRLRSVDNRPWGFIKIVRV